MINNNLYALLIGVGDYTKMNSGNLPTYKMDLALLGTALTFKLKLAKENMRLMAGDDKNGFVPTADLARAISGFNKLLGDEDTFIFYFSGHGNKKSLVFKKYDGMDLTDLNNVCNINSCNMNEDEGNTQY